MTSFAAPLRTYALMILGALTLVLGGCASTNNPRDPLEPFNRVVYNVNDSLDRAVMKPVATAYTTVVPQFVRTGITNFFSNLSDILTALNNILQGKFVDAASDAGRVAVNSTVGLLGLVDVGSELGLEKHREDFGQTLGRWGFASGPYLQVPIFGPSSVRDSIGQAVDFQGDPVGVIWRDHIATRNSLWGLYYVNLRARLLDSTKILDEAALDPYEFQRDAYLQRRRNLVYDGSPPPDSDQEDVPEIKTKPRTELDDPEPAPRSGLPLPRAVTPASARTDTPAVRATTTEPTPARPFLVQSF